MNGAPDRPSPAKEPSKNQVRPAGKIDAISELPATLFTQGLPTGELVDSGTRIARAFENRVLVNVGDILPPEGDIGQVIALARR